MARSFFPEFAGGDHERTWPAAAATVSRVAWLATALLAGLACVLATVFAGLWWRGEIQEASVSRAMERTSAEADRLTSEQSRQRRVIVSTKLDTAAQLASLTEESSRLRQALEATQTQAAAAYLARRSAEAQLDQQTAEARLQAASLQQEQFRAANLEQNLTLTQTDLQQRAAEHDQHVDSLQTHLISLRSTVTEREVEVRNITSAATQEIDRTRLAAQEISQEAEWLAAQLRTVSCERDQYHAEVLRLQQCLASERAANQNLAQRICQLECRIRELESQPSPVPGGQGGVPISSIPGHPPSHGRPGLVR